MATISKIRKRSGLVIALIGVSIALFLLNDALTSQPSLTGDNDNTVGEIAGEGVSAQEFARMYDLYLNNYVQNQGVTNPSAEQRMQVNNQAWEGIIQERMLGDEYSELGINVTKEELWDMVQGPDPDENVKKAFADENGVFNRANLINFIQNIDQVTAEQRNSWIQFEQGLKDDKRRSKYFNLIQKGIYVTNLEAKEDYLAKNKMAKIEFVALKSADHIDSTATVTDAEIMQYAKEHIQDYEQKDERSIKYVSFETVPSKADTLKMQQTIAQISSEFKTSKNPLAFARLKSEASIDTTAKSPADLYQSEASIADQIINADSGEVFGPFYQFGKYKLVKLLGVRETKQKFYRASHILIKVDEQAGVDSVAALAKAKEVLAEINGGETFEDMARKYGSDATASKGGDLGWFKEGTMVPRFQKAVNNAEVGKNYLVNTRFGTHLVKVTAEPSNKMYNLVSIEKTIVPSSETIDEAYNLAATFKDKAVDAQGFADAIKEMGIDAKIQEGLKPMDATIPGIKDARPLISWAFREMNVDAVSDIQEFENQYVVAVLTEIKVEGELDIENNRLAIKQAILNQKASAALAEKLKNANASDIASLASSVGTEVQTADNIAFNTPVIPQLGTEPKVVGTVFGIQEGTLSPVIEGREGAYVVIAKGFSEVNIPSHFSQYKTSILSSNSASAQFYAINALKELAEVKDQRYKFY